MAVISNQTFPYTEVSLTVEFDPWETGERVKKYLAINEVDAIIADKNGIEITDPESYTDVKYIQWNIPKLDADGNVVKDASGKVIYNKVTAPYWEASKKSCDLYVPVGSEITSVKWTEEQVQNLPIRWITQKVTGQRYFPITHIDAVIDAQGNKLTSVINWCREEVDDYGDRLKSVETKLLKEIKNYLQLSTPVAESLTANGYRSTDLLTFFIGDEIIIPSDGNYPGMTVTLVDEDGNIITSSALPLDYTAKEDESFYVYTSQRVGGLPVNFTTKTLASRAGGGSDIALAETANTVVIVDNDNTKTYTVAKANTVVTEDGVTIKAAAMGDGTKKISVAPELTGMSYDETTHALKSNAAAGSENVASGNYSLAIGKENTASGEDAIALGDSNTASGVDSVAVGVGNVASGDYAEALGVYNTAKNFAQTTLGYKAVQHGDDGDAWAGDNAHTALAVGVNNANAIEVMQDGTVYVKGVGGYDGSNLGTAASLQAVVATGGIAVDDDTIEVTASGLSVKDNAVDMDKVSTDIKQKLDGITLVPVTTTASGTTAALGGTTSYITTTPTTLKEGDKVKLAVGDSLCDATGDPIFTATAGSDTYTAPDDCVVYISTPDASGTVSYDKTTYVASIALADGSVTLAKLSTDVQQAINDAGKADEVTITKNAATSEMSVKDGGITEDKLAGGSVTEGKIANGAVTTGKLANGSVITTKIADDAITADKIADDAVETDAIKDGAITKDKLDATLKDAIAEPDGTTLVKNATDKLEIKDGGIATAKVADSAIVESKLATDSVTTSKIKDANVTSDKLATDSVTSDKIASEAVTESELAADAVTTEKIKDANVTKDKLADDAKVGSMVVTEEAGGVKVEIKDAAGSVIASDTIGMATDALAGMVKVDKELDSTSENPVQNKLVGVTITKDTTPAATDAYSYTFAQGGTDLSPKVVMPIASTTVYGEVKIDEQFVKDASGKYTSTNVPTTKAISEYVENALGDLAGAMTYEGIVDSTHTLPTTYKQGATYVVAEDGTYEGNALVVGNMLIANADSDKGGTWTAVRPTPKVDNKDVELVNGVKATIAVVDGKDITVTIKKTYDDATDVTEYPDYTI